MSGADLKKTSAVSTPADFRAYINHRSTVCLSRCYLLLCIATAALSLLGGSAAHAQKFPTQTIKIIVPYAPGGSTDLTARVIGAKLAERLGKPVIVENRSGASAQVGIQAVVGSPANGHTLLVTPNGPISISSHLGKLPYDPATDLVPVAMLASVPSGVAVPQSSPSRGLDELIAAAKAKPEGLNYSVSGVGTLMHLAGEMLQAMTGAKLVAVPYRGTNPASAAIASGEVPVGISDLTTLLPLAKGGRIRILAVIDASRTATAPDIPTVAELGVKGYAANGWIGIFAPAGTSSEIVDRLNAEVAWALSLPEVHSTFINAGLDPAPMKPAEMRRFVTGEIEKWGKLISSANIKLD